MLLKSLKLKNIRSYTDGRIDFPSGSILLAGDIGTGKSTILLAMDFALFGIRRGELSGDELLRHGSNSGSVELEFSVGGNEYTVKRCLKRNKSIAQDSCFLSSGGIEQELTPTELSAKVLEIFGYPKEAMKKDIPIFRYTIYTPQEEMKRILFDADSRLATLRRVFNVDRYGNIRESAKLVLTELRSMKRELEAYSADMEDKIAERSEKEASKEKIEIELKNISAVLENVNSSLAEKTGEAEKIRARINELNSMKRELTRKETESKAKSDRITSIEKELEKLEDKIKTLNDEISAFDGIEKPQEAQNTSFFEGHKQVIIAERAVIIHSIKNLEKLLDSGICYACGQSIYKPEEFRENIDKKKSSLDTLELKISEFDDAIRVSRASEEKARNYNITMEKRRSAEKNLTSLINWKNSIEDEQKQLNDSLCLLEKDRLFLEDNIKSTGDVEDIYRILEKELIEINKEKSEAERAEARLIQQDENVNQAIAVLSEDIEKKRAAREKISRVNECLNWLSSYFISLMDIIEKNVMASLQQEFNAEFQQWFNILVPEDLTVRIDEQFSPMIEQNSYETEYQNLSGGEKTSVALAYRLALNSVINSMIETIKTKDLLILDEPTDGFSSEQVDRIRDIINELKLKQIILVSHEPKIDTFVENVIKIYKEGHESRVENYNN